jgi:hypothetical protein
VRCKAGACNMTCSSGSHVDVGCDGGIIVCGRACP